MNLLQLTKPNYQCHQGRYLRWTNQTPGTGIAMGIRTTFSETANGLLCISNPASAGGKSFILDYVRLICSAAGASTTASDLVIATDTIQRVSSGGTALLRWPGSNTANQVDGATVVTLGDITFAAQSANRRYLARMRLKTQAAPCWVVGDEVFIKFGGAEHCNSGLLSGAAAARYAFATGPVILGPGNNHSCTFHMFNTANATTPPSWEAEIGGMEI